MGIDKKQNSKLRQSFEVHQSRVGDLGIAEVKPLQLRQPLERLKACVSRYFSLLANPMRKLEIFCQSGHYPEIIVMITAPKS